MSKIGVNASQGPIRIGVAVCLATACLLATSELMAQDPDGGWDQSTLATFSYWAEQFSLPAGASTQIDLNESISTDEEIVVVIDLAGRWQAEPQRGLSQLLSVHVTGALTLNSDSSLVRILLMDAQGIEHLVYETYPLLVNANTYEFGSVCEESCLMEGIVLQGLKVELIDAVVELGQASIIETTAPLPVGSAAQIKAFQNGAKIDEIRNKIAALNLKWRAGPTPVSELPYAGRNAALGGLPGSNIVHLHGLEFYKGGIFERQDSDDATLPKSTEADRQGGPPDAFDWRNRHGADNPISEKYDGDLNRDGWMTPVRNQFLPSAPLPQAWRATWACWAFAGVGATEAVTNLYFNQHLDLDLSEQEICSCSSGGTCSTSPGGQTAAAVDYIAATGVVDEDCFPFSAPSTATDESCGNVCSAPTDAIVVDGKQGGTSGIASEDVLKTLLIENGPMTIARDGHAMVLTGYYTDPSDGLTVWVYKNSAGGGWVGWRDPFVPPDLNTQDSWGVRGYLHEKTRFANIWRWHTFAVLNPIVSAIQPYEIECEDLDGDGLFNWGLSAMRPGNCPVVAPATKDCDDASPYLGSFSGLGTCDVTDAGPHMITSLVGDKDNFTPGDVVDQPLRSHRTTEILSFLENVKSIIGQNSVAALDEGGTNRPVGFTHFFYLSDQAVIVGAELTLSVRGTANVNNDAIFYDDSVSTSEQRLTPTNADLDCATTPPGILCDPEQFFPLVTLRDILGAEPTGQTEQLILNLSRTPVRVGGDPGPGNSWSPRADEYRNLLHTLYDGDFNIILLDDVTVDYSELRLTYVLPTSAAQGDLNGDTVINMLDFIIFRATLGKCRGEGGYTHLADYDQSGCINYRDFVAWYGYFQNQ